MKERGSRFMPRRGKASVRQLALPLGREVHGDETAAGAGGGDAPVEGMDLLEREVTLPLNPPNRRIRDPYVRWCGRRGAARLLPIPIELINSLPEVKRDVTA